MALSRSISKKNRIIEELLLISILSLATYLFLGYLLGIELHALAVFSSFFILPVIVLKILKKPLALGKLDLGFLLGILIYIIFFFWIFFYYLNNKEFFINFKLHGYELLKWNLFAALNVMPVDFFTKRIVQAEVSKGFGQRKGLLVQTLVWGLAHGYEISWLQELMAFSGALLFIIGSGLITGYLYLKTENVLGLMVGHWLLNFLICMVANLL